MQDLAPAQQCGTEGRTGHQGWEGGNGDRNRDEGVDRSEDEYRNEHKGRDEGKNGSENGDENRGGGGGKREPGNLQSDNTTVEVGRKTREGRDANK